MAEAGLRGPNAKGWHRTLRSSDLLPGEIFAATAGRHLLIARLTDGEVVAFASNCPHQNTELEGATVWDNKIRCPRHQYLYDARTGENIHPRQRFGPEKLWKTKPGYLPCYAVRESDGWIWVFEQPKPPPASWDPALEVPPDGAVLEPEEEEAPTGPVETIKVVRVQAGATFELRLPVNPLPGNVWHVEAVGDLVEVLEDGILDSDPSKWRVKVKAHDVGEDALECRFTAPWDVEPSELRRYVVQVVRGA